MVAELLSWPHVNIASKIDYNDSGMTVAREVEGGQVETFAVSTPVVIGAHKSLNNPRYASLPGIMKAKRKPFQKITLEELDLNPSELAANVHTKAIKFNYPPEKPKGRVVQGESIEQMVDQAVAYLKDEAKVL